MLRQLYRSVKFIRRVETAPRRFRSTGSSSLMADDMGDIATSPRPMVDRSLALSLLKRLYPVEAEPEILREFPSYDDRGFHVLAKLKNSDKIEEFVLKVHHQMHSDDVAFLQAHAELLLHVGKYGFQCPMPAVSNEGSLFCRVDLPHALHGKSTHAVSLWKFVAGVMMKSVGRPTDALLSSVGCYLARLHDCLGDLQGSSTESGIKNRHLTWSITNALESEDGIPFIPDASLRTTAQSVLNRYSEEIVPRMSLMRQGVIHGDANEGNIILNPLDTDSVYGIIDTCDTDYAPYVADLAISLAYLSLLMTAESPCSATAPIVRSYCRNRPLSDLEKETLHLWMMVRQVQSIAFGYKAYAEDPGNDYLLMSVRPAAVVLPKLFALSAEQVHDAWFGSDMPQP